MLNYLWCFMILAGIIVSCFNGNITSLSTVAFDSASDAVTLCLTMLSVVSVWSGLMEIAKVAGLTKRLSKLIMPFMHWLFPEVPEDGRAMEYMCTNMIANFLGLGWAATPAALVAMKELSKLNSNSPKASNAMCTFLVINISSIQLIPVNIIAYRQSFGSPNPTSIIAPAIIATLCSTLVGILFCKLMQTCKRR